MENYKISSASRSESGKGTSRKLRAAGRLPAVLYGQKEQPVQLTVDETDMRGVLHAHPDSAIVALSIENGESGINALVRDVQRHPATGRVLHIDFQRIRLDEMIRVEVHVELEGIPVGVKDLGGILEHVTRSVNVMSLPTSIPEAIVLDVSELGIHDSLRLRDVVAKYPDVEFLEDEGTTLANVMPPVVEKVETEEGEEGEAAATEPEVVGEEKKDESSEE